MITKTSLPRDRSPGSGPWRPFQFHLILPFLFNYVLPTQAFFLFLKHTTLVPDAGPTLFLFPLTGTFFSEILTLLTFLHYCISEEMSPPQGDFPSIPWPSLALQPQALSFGIFKCQWHISYLTFSRPCGFIKDGLLIERELKVWSMMWAQNHG